MLADFTDKALKLSESWSGGSPGPKGKSGSGRTGKGDDGTGDGGARPTVSGSPEGAPDHPLSAAADGDPSTSYRAAVPPATATFTPQQPPMLVPPAAAAEPGTGDGDDAGGGRPARDALTVRLPEPRPLRAVTVLTGPDSGTRGTVEAHVPGKGWQRLGALSRTGWTHLATGGHEARADAVRLVWSQDAKPPVVHDEITPWYADTPEASLSLPRTTVDAAIGGGTTRVTARLTGNRPTDVRDKVTVHAPKGFTVRTPARTTVRRGGTVDVPLRISADSSVGTGSYRIPVSFGGERRTLTVRAYPRTSGPDLARGARATSSGDETKDFPAAAVADGKRGTRWSSPAEDGAWVQVELAERARVGQGRPALAGRLRGALPDPGLPRRQALAHRRHGAGRRRRQGVGPDGLAQGHPLRPGGGRQAGDALRDLAVVDGGLRRGLLGPRQARAAGRRQGRRVAPGSRGAPRRGTPSGTSPGRTKAAPAGAGAARQSPGLRQWICRRSGRDRHPRRTAGGRGATVDPCAPCR